jgi:hypothetical protein
LFHEMIVACMLGFNQQHVARVPRLLFAGDGTREEESIDKERKNKKTSREGEKLYAHGLAQIIKNLERDLKAVAVSEKTLEEKTAE